MDDRTAERDPWHFFAAALPAAGGAAWAPGRRLYVADAAASRAVLANREGLYREHSDFFHTRRGILGPRALQVEIGRAARSLLRAHLRRHRDELPAAVARLGATSEWPDAGNRLIHRHVGPALLAPGSAPRLAGLLEQVVERAVLSGARERRSRLGRALFRARVQRELAREIRRRRGSSAPVRDVLDVVARAGGGTAAPEALGEVYLSFLFATAGSVGFLLGWALYLLGTHAPSTAPPHAVAREALRLWPIAWQLARRPAREHEIAGARVTPDDEVIVCPLAVHRNPAHWRDPASFRPERWDAPHDRGAFLPFGWGPHRCIAGTLSLQLVEDVLRAASDGHRLAVTAGEQRPRLEAALAPPRFTLHLLPLEPASGQGSTLTERR